MFFTKFLINDLPTKKCILNQKHWEKERNYYKKSQCTILLYYPIERKKYARICSVNVHVTICPLIYIPCVHMPPIIIPPFDIPREYIWKKRNYPSDIFEFIFSKFIVFFPFRLLSVVSLSLLFFSKLFKKKSFLVALLSTLRNFCTVVLCLQYFVSFLKKQREKSYIWSIVYFWSLIYLWVPSPTSRRKKIWKYSIAKYIRENHLL